METVTTSYGLIERAKSGDSEAYSAIFARYRPRLAVLIHYRISPEMRPFADVDDILQETLLRGFRDIHRFTYQSPGSFMSWLSHIAGHVIADLGRAQGRQKRHAAEVVRFRSDSNPEGPEPADSKTPSRLLAQQEGLRELLDRLNSLPEDYRQAILLAKVEGLSTREVAERLGKSKEAAALLLHRAVKRFRSLEQPGERR